jgi:hypothetical protein
VTQTVQAGAANTVPVAGPAPSWPADWDHLLDTAIRTWGGEWDTKRVQRLYLTRYGLGLYRADARAFLSRRARAGLLVLDDTDPNHRTYTRNSRKDVRP